ncbi:hypothetical protein [Endomicrobium proavitum]|uniref:Uncharacterized protein n=1 Tax=Endomicrobium proavitum TaxID=1408281 RepID=A0A0G3WJE2_9BACT|nr:hypothetical protein [Endomicrobium proavitum]AKL97967.1 exported protein of unknown function [Endomicrobium proavitum]
MNTIRVFALLFIVSIFSVCALAENVRWVSESKAYTPVAAGDSSFDKTKTVLNNTFPYHNADRIRLSGDSYKPAGRNYIAGSAIQFNNLESGDIVVIFKTSGSEVARLTAPPYIWYGKKGTNNSGSYVESTSYICQIYVNPWGHIADATIGIIR